MKRMPNLCFYCKHRREPVDGNPLCDAFPSGIPLAISHTSHWEPYEGDNEVIFEPESDISPEELVRIKLTYRDKPSDFREEWLLKYQKHLTERSPMHS